MKNSILTSDVLELFDRNHITANTLRKFVVESVADFLGDNKHDEAINEAKQLYEDLYADYNKRYHCWRRHEERKTDED